MNKFYLTTTLPYVNSDPHLGFALEMVLADSIVRYHKLLGKEIFFNTGTDEHGLKIYQKALECGIDPQKYCDEYAEKFKKLIPALGILPEIHFIRTTDSRHILACQEFWKLVEKNGFIYKAKYKVKYCVGCELEKTESDLDENGKCAVHPHLDLEIREEENYFFKFSAFQKPLLDLYEKYPDFVVPDFRFKEIKEFVKKGLQDFSISRLKEKMPWGVPVPNDENHVMYVWFDALINYISTLGWDVDNVKIKNQKSKFEEYWGTKENPKAIQIAGKDNLRQQSAMWQAMLLAADLPTSRQIIIHGFINSGGQKMSKSLGNVADPYEILNKLEQKGLTNEQAIDALRYYLLREIPTFEDGDYTWEHFVETYNANLANGLGNLVSRVMKMALMNGISTRINIDSSHDPVVNAMDSYKIQIALEYIWSEIHHLDARIQKTQPFKVIKTDPQKAAQNIKSFIAGIYSLADDLRYFLPFTSNQIFKALEMSHIGHIPKLFPRI